MGVFQKTLQAKVVSVPVLLVLKNCEYLQNRCATTNTAVQLRWQMLNFRYELRFRTEVSTHFCYRIYCSCFASSSHIKLIITRTATPTFCIVDIVKAKQ